MEIQSLGNFFKNTLQLAGSLYDENLFKPFDPKSNQWKLRSYKAYYDAVMVGLSHHLDNRDTLLQQKSMVLEETKELFRKDTSKMFTGGSKNTQQDIRDRIETFENAIVKIISQ